MNNLQQLDEALDILNGTNLITIDNIIESVVNEENIFRKYLSEFSIEAVDEKVDFKSLKDKIIEKIKKLVDKFITLVNNCISNLKLAASKAKAGIIKKITGDFEVDNFKVTEKGKDYFGKEAIDKCYQAIEDIGKLSDDNISTLENYLMYQVDNYIEKYKSEGSDESADFKNAKRDIITNHNVLANKSKNPYTIPANWAYLEKFEVEGQTSDNKIMISEVSKKLFDSLSIQMPCKIDTLKNITRDFLKKKSDNINDNVISSLYGYIISGVQYAISTETEYVKKANDIYSKMIKYKIYIHNEVTTSRNKEKK